MFFFLEWITDRVWSKPNSKFRHSRELGRTLNIRAICTVPLPLYSLNYTTNNKILKIITVPKYPNTTHS